ACNLHDCLNKHTYSPDKCDHLLRELYLCCQQFYDQTNNQGESTACPMPRVVKRWLTDHPPKRYD
ncbi:hypothetical protein BDZ89DRAFT_944548, partial [Hymenopellis radicata]